MRSVPVAMTRTLLLIVAGASAALGASPDFLDVTEACGIDFVGTYGTTFVDEDMVTFQRNMGNGAAVGDYDGDGDLDILLLGQQGHPNVLLRNDLDQGAKGFTDVTDEAGVGDRGLARVAHFVDLDNDGHLDLLVVNDDDGTTAHRSSRVYRNDGDGTFTDVTFGSGFAPTGYLRCGMALNDYDQDGLIDAYVTNWGAEGGNGNSELSGHNVLLRNLGDFQFADRTLDAGLGILDRDSFSAIFHDFDGNGYPDLYVAVDHTSDEFYWNHGGDFVNATLEVGATHTGNDMGVACADFDNDDDLDLYSTNITDSSGIFGTTSYNVLYINGQSVLGRTSFVDAAVRRGVEDTYWGWGVEFTDVENDGDLDIVAVTGFDELILDVIGTHSPVYRTPSVLLLNDGNGFFSRSSPGPLGLPDDSRALIAFDYDRDGDEDLLITNVDQPARLLENVSEPRGHWLEVALVQAPGANRNGIGAIVRATVGSTTHRRDLVAGDSYLAGTPPELHFGLGEATTIDRLRVAWTDGSESVYDDVSADRFVTIRQGVDDADIDGVEDAADNCATAVNPDQANADMDAAGDACDCANGDGELWSAPSAVTDLALSGVGPTELSWSDVADPGGTGAPRYDVLRSAAPDFTSVACIASETLTTTAADGDPVVGIFYYLVRSGNPCGTNGGVDTTGTARQLPACPS